MLMAPRASLALAPLLPWNYSSQPGLHNKSPATTTSPILSKQTSFQSEMNPECPPRQLQLPSPEAWAAFSPDAQHSAAPGKVNFSVQIRQLHSDKFRF